MRLALLWTPLFFAAHATAKLLSSWVPQWDPNGYTAPYQYAAILGNEVYGVIGIVLIFAAFGTPVAYYVLHDPGQRHVPSLFAVALFVWFWLRTRPLATLTGAGGAAPRSVHAGFRASRSRPDAAKPVGHLRRAERDAVSFRVPRPLAAPRARPSLVI